MPTINQYKLIIFDVDGTLTETKSGATFRKSADDWQWLPGRLDKLKALRKAGVRLAVATNQGGVAFGLLDQSAILGELFAMCIAGGIPRWGLYICYNHPAAKLPQFRHVDERRKPGPGMLIDAMDDFEAMPNETLMVGDRPEDEEAALNAGCDFMWAKDFFEGTDG